MPNKKLAFTGKLLKEIILNFRIFRFFMSGEKELYKNIFYFLAIEQFEVVDIDDVICFCWPKVVNKYFVPDDRLLVATKQGTIYTVRLSRRNEEKLYLVCNELVKTPSIEGNFFN